MPNDDHWHVGLCAAACAGLCSGKPGHSYRIGTRTRITRTNVQLRKLSAKYIDET
jgi:hypothetical protein